MQRLELHLLTTRRSSDLIKESVNPPAVTLTHPANNAKYISGENVYLTAIASGADGSISKIDFYSDTTLLYTATDTPYTFIWKNVVKGTYILSAKATDNNGLATVSDSVYISVVDNKPPNVSIINPANGQIFLQGATIHLRAAATDSDGTIAKVELYQDTALITTENRSSYTFDYTIRRSGNYTFTARATDNLGAVTISEAITVSVVPNQPPTVNIIMPANGQVFTAPATINFEAAAQDADGRIVQVGLYNGATLLTNEHKLPYTYQWQNVPAGTYTITAVAKDNWSAETTSSPVTVTVTAAGESLMSRTAPAHELPAIKLSPNPARKILNINIAGLQKNTPSTLSLISASGVTIRLLSDKTQQRNSISSSSHQLGGSELIQVNVSAIASGMYIIKMISGEKVLYKQFIKM